MKKYRAALAGYYGFSNLGDELLLEAAINALERCGLDRCKDLIILSNKPDETAQKFKVQSVSRWKFRDVRRALIESETLLLGGGGLFQDSTSLRSCVWYWGLVRLARLCGAKPWALGQSIGPLHRCAARWFTRDALKICRVLHVRDMPSLDLARKLGLNHCQLGADLALTLPGANACASSNTSSNSDILVNLRPLPELELEKFIDAAADFCERECAHERKNIVGIALSPEDKILLEQVRSNGRIKFSSIELVRTRDEINAIWENASAAIGMRLHFAILAALFGTPLVVLPYDPKVTAFAQWVGLETLITGKNLTPRVPVLPVAPELAREEIDALCRMFLALS